MAHPQPIGLNLGQQNQLDYVEEGQFDDAEEQDVTKTMQNLNTKNANYKVLFKPDCSPDMTAEEEEGNNNYYSDSDDVEYGEDDWLVVEDKKPGPNSQQQTKQCPPEEMLKKYVNKINVDKYEGVQLTSEAANALISTNKKITANRKKVKDKKDRATVEQVMDPRTRMIIYKLISNDKISAIDGCISTGKEANVYHATAASPAATDGSSSEFQSLAIKVFKTSILTFKQRDKYVSGEFRFRNGYCKKNPRKMVSLWAEKEYRNLLRIYSAGTILVPKPLLLKSHVLVMQFIGQSGWPAPLLKDVKFQQYQGGSCKEDEEEEGEGDYGAMMDLLTKLYRDALLILYRLYKHCKLVHADFSEFNLILKDWTDLYVIDVSQSVEHDHPKSLDFLRSDIKNIQQFFGKRNVLVGEYKSIFDWITSPTIDDTCYEQCLAEILKNAKELKYYAVDDEVFRQTFIPKKMSEVLNYERDFNKVKKDGERFAYTTMFGMKPDLSGPEQMQQQEQVVPVLKEDERFVGPTGEILPQKENTETEADKQAETDSDDDSGDDSDSNAEEDGTKFSNSARPKDETPEQKRERKKAVKEEKAGKRETKMKKHIKKRKEKLTHANAKRK